VIARSLLKSEDHPRPLVLYVAPDADDRVTVRGFYVVARRKALAGPFETAREAESTCIALGGDRR
jgi:hypothetical protein